VTSGRTASGGDGLPSTFDPTRPIRRFVHTFTCVGDTGKTIAAEVTDGPQSSFVLWEQTAVGVGGGAGISPDCAG
jgi:hypothetical protein